MMTEGGGCGSFGRAYSLQEIVESLTDQHTEARHGGHTCNSSTQIEEGDQSSMFFFFFPPIDRSIAY